MQDIDRIIEINEKKQNSADVVLIWIVVLAGLFSAGLIYITGYQTPILRIFDGETGVLIMLLRALEPIVIGMVPLVVLLFLTDRFVRTYIRREVYPTHIIEYFDNAVVVWGSIRNKDFEYIKKQMFAGRNGYAVCDRVPEKYRGATVVSIPVAGLNQNI